MNAHSLNILITQKADVDEASLYQYIEGRFGAIHADKFRSKLIELFNKLALMPAAGRVATNDRSIRIFILNRQNKVVYKATETHIVILRILPTKTNTAGNY